MVSVTTNFVRQPISSDIQGATQTLFYEWGGLELPWRGQDIPEQETAEGVTQLVGQEMKPIATRAT